MGSKDPVLETLQQGDVVKYDEIIATQKYSKAKGHYTEASLIKELVFGKSLSSIQTPAISRCSNFLIRRLTLLKLP